MPNHGAANFLVSYTTTLAHIRAPRRSTSLGLVLRVVWDIVRRHASTRCDYPVSACGTMSSGDFTDSVSLTLYKRYANAPRLDVVVLQALCAKGRAAPPPALERLFPTSTKSPHLPREIFWRILSYWRTDRDP